MKADKFTTEVVMTDAANYIRAADAAGAEWTKAPRTDNSLAS